MIDSKLRDLGIAPETIELIKSAFTIEQIEDLIGEPSEVGEHIKTSANCMYCGETTDSIDPNVLCPQCRQDFGHTFYSEL